ncbi:MAG: hypothetical protein IKV17_05525 [Bacteroidaceae bacterium]|nr:hypothetical protein [Bacteroidaceae bacterium]
MDIELSDNAKKEIVNYSKYLAKTTKFDKEKIQELTTKFEEQLKKNINSSDNEHSDSIFPRKTKFGKGYKMCVDKSKHRVIFYKIDKDENGKEVARIHECPHSTELKKELDKKGIEPLEDSDPKLLLDYITVEKEDKVNNETLTDEEREEYKKKEDKLKERISNKSKENKKEEVTDPETGKKIKKVKHTGPRGGHYYINDKGEHIYPEEWNESIKNMKSVKTYITESKMVSLVDYLKKMVG